MAPTDEDGPEDFGVDIDAIQADLTDMEASLKDRIDLLERGFKLRDEYAIESQVDVDVPPVVADYVRAVVPETATMTVEERNQLLVQELMGFEARTTRYYFPNGDILEDAPDGVVFTHESNISINE
ncbi:hypothetical protein [Salinigranum salinum]|uniref:hypothetical protein n=1 Tax=Salinigranum salinum TaxID=1364937 RepID=UPI0012605A45|nr:hypothetical protein [Salinigranum salinum]